LLVELHDRDALAVAGPRAQRVLGVVQPRALEPAGPGHLAVGEDRVVGPGPDVEVAPDRGPESLEVVDRPRPEVRVRREVAPDALGEPAHVAGQLRARGGVLGRRPDDRAAAHRSPVTSPRTI